MGQDWKKGFGVSNCDGELIIVHTALRVAFNFVHNVSVGLWSFYCSLLLYSLHLRVTGLSTKKEQKKKEGYWIWKLAPQYRQQIDRQPVYALCLLSWNWAPQKRAWLCSFHTLPSGIYIYWLNTYISTSHTPVPSLSQVERPEHSQSFIIGEKLQSLNHFSSLYCLQCSLSCTGSPEVDTVLQVWPQQNWVERITSLNLLAAQKDVDLIWRKATLYILSSKYFLKDV